MTDSPLITLPVEILEKILEALFSVPDSEICLGQDNDPIAAVGYQPPLSILRTCKQAGAVGTRVLQSSIADCRLVLWMTTPAAFTTHCVPFIKQYGKLFKSVHIVPDVSYFAIGRLFKHLVNIEDITFPLGQWWFAESQVAVNSGWLSLDDSELQKHLWQPSMPMIRRIAPYVTKLQSAYPRIDELVVRVAVCITFEKDIDHRLVKN